MGSLLFDLNKFWMEPRRLFFIEPFDKEPKIEKIKTPNK